MGTSDLQSHGDDGRPPVTTRRGVDFGQESQTPQLLDASPSRRQNDESWVELASQPSSSSLSSIGDEIITTGLRVGAGSYPVRRRRAPQHNPMPASFIVGHGVAAGTSSQEEYDETESEEDRVMTSSTEAVHPASGLLRQQTAVRAAVAAESDSDDDENATALGRPSNAPSFQPQPNAFSHPPSHLTHRHSTSSVHPYHSSQSRPSPPMRSHTRSHRGPPNYLSPAYQADNDAALRASLTTLLSCAAAARGLPKADDRRGFPAVSGLVPSTQPMDLRLVPESELMAENGPPHASPAGPAPPKVPERTASNSSAPSAPASSSGRERERNAAAPSEKSKRAAAVQSRPPRATKKKRTGSSAGLAEGEPTTTLISPTLMTWMVSAGVVVLVSVVGFGAGYVIGREVGRQEGALGLGSAAAPNATAASCGREVVKGTSGVTLRRFRWGAMGKSVAA